MDKFYHLASSIKQHCYRVAHAFTTPKVCNYLAPFFPHSLQHVKSLLFRYFSILFLELSQPLKGFTSMTACISIHRNTHTHTHTHAHTVYTEDCFLREKNFGHFGLLSLYGLYSVTPLNLYIYIYIFNVSYIKNTIFVPQWVKSVQVTIKCARRLGEGENKWRC